MQRRNFRGYGFAAIVLAACAVFLVTSSRPLQGQVLNGSIRGNVVDQTGAVVPGADVTITHPETGRVRTAVTNDMGVYDFPSVRTGTWTVKVTMPGFNDFEETGVKVALNTVARVNVRMRVGNVQETLTVSAANTPVLQTDRAEVRAEIGEKEIKELPVAIGRNYQGLFGTLPGFSTPTNAHSVPTNPSRALQFNVNGTSRSSNDIRIDGASQFDIWLPHITVYIPSLEAIETVNVVTNSFDAEQGLAGGAAINVQIKSGTNDYHGSAYWYNTNNALMAKPFFLPVGERNPKYINNQYGGTIGGPIVKDKLFFFASYEATPERSFASDSRDILAMAMRQGDFSASKYPIYDPLTGNPDGTGRTPFPNNQIPVGRIHPISKKIIDLLPAPTNDALNDNYYAAGVYKFDRSVLDSKVDWHINDRLNMYGRLSILRYEMDAPTLFGDELLGPAIAGGNSRFADGGTYGTTIAATYVFTPTFVVDGNFGYTRKDTASEQSRLDEKIGLDFLGLPGTNGTRKFEGGWPRIRVDGFDDIGIPNNFMPYYRRDPQFQWAGNANWTRGSHNIRLGGELAKQHMNQTQPEFPGADFPAQGGFRFQSGVTNIEGGKADNEHMSAAAFLLGLPRQRGRILQVDEEYSTRMNFYSLYLRDQWQLTPKVTLSIGTRWEYLPMPTRKDRGVERYDFVNNKMMVCGVGSVPKDCGVELSKTLFAPRLGLAFRVTDRFVIRAGYGITNDPFSLARPHRTNHPMLLPFNDVSADSNAPIGSFEEGVPPVVAPDLGNGIVDVPPQVAVNSVGETLDRGYIQSWNLSLQRELFARMTGEVAYVATRSVRQLGYQDLNAGQVLGAGRDGQPYYAPFGRTTRTAMFTPIGHSSYDGMQLRLERRFTEGLAVNANYTWSKTMGIAGLGASDGMPRIRALEYYHLNRAVADIHIPHRFNLSTLVELPFGAAKPFVNDGWGAKILGGWQLNTAMYAQSGTPFDITAPGGTLEMPGSTQRADQVKPTVDRLYGVGPGQLWFDTTAFVQPEVAEGEFRFGTAGFNTLSGPAQFNLDVGLFRTFAITEGKTLQFRAEAFNFTNTPHLANPNGDSSSNNFGQIRSTRNTGREGLDQRAFRFALRFAF